MNIQQKFEQLPTFDVLGVDISITSLSLSTLQIINWARDSAGRFVCVRDVHGVMLSVKDPALLAIHKKAAMVTPDGMPLVLLGKMAGYDISRTCGADLMEEVIKAGQKTGLRHYFFGGQVGVADRLVEKMREKYPEIQVVGIESPPFRKQSLPEIRETTRRIKTSGADVVWVGLSTPKQERWMHANSPFLPATLIGVGAAFDFHSGDVARAPKWMQQSGFEWAHRLFSQPRRLWRRYLIMAPQFILAVLKRKISVGGKG